MFIALLYIGLLVTPFVFFPDRDIRDIKMTAAVIIATALCAAGLYFSGIRRFKNKWLLLLLAYIPVSIFFAPSPTIKLLGLDVSYFWAWEPYLQIVLFSIMAMAIAGQNLQDHIENILSVMYYCGLFTAAYMILQYLMIDQWFLPMKDFLSGRGNVAGFIGNPTLSAPFVGMLVPIALYQKRYIGVLVMLAAIICADSQIAYGSLFVAILFFYGVKGPKRFVACCGVLALAGALLVGNYLSVRPEARGAETFFKDNDRLRWWKQAGNDLISPISKDIPNSYPVTGRGLGSFKFVFHSEHPGDAARPNRLAQAHNDYLEFAYSTGFIGLFLLFMAIYQMFKRRVTAYRIFSSGVSARHGALLSSFVCIALCAGGTFVWQIGTTVFYSVVLVGLLHNESI